MLSLQLSTRPPQNSRPNLRVLARSSATRFCIFACTKLRASGSRAFILAGREEENTRCLAVFVAFFGCFRKFLAVWKRFWPSHFRNVSLPQVGRSSESKCFCFRFRSVGRMLIISHVLTSVQGLTWIGIVVWRVVFRPAATQERIGVEF